MSTSVVGDAEIPHAVQVGTAPAFIGAGAGDLACPCGQSVLIRGYLPQNFLAIRIKCFRCGAITVTPGLPEGELLPRDAMPVARLGVAMVASTPIPRAAVYVCQDAMERAYALTRPRNPPPEPMQISPVVLDSVADNYDRITGGSLQAHIAASRGAKTLDDANFPFAWCHLRLGKLSQQPGWSWLNHNDDAMAAMHVAAFWHFMRCWGQHPQLERLASSLSQPGRFVRVMTGFAATKLLFDAGNRVGIIEATPYLSAIDGAPLSLAMFSPDPLQWRARGRWSPQVIRSSVLDALSAAQGRVNARRPGVLVLSVSILLPDFEQALVNGIAAVLRSAGRRHRGVAAIVAIMPKVGQAMRPDQVGFSYNFYPLRNEHYLGENPIRLGTEQDFAPAAALDASRP